MNDSTKMQCVIFDLDGTLVDSESISCRILLELIPAINETEEALAKRMLGRKFVDVIAETEKMLSIKVPENFEQEFRAKAAIKFEQELVAYPGVVEMLEKCTLPCCIASNGPMPKMRKSLSITGLAKYFGENLYSAYDVGSWKPHPGLFLHAAREMGFSPANCVVVEDSISGVEAAIAAEMKVLHFTRQHTMPPSEIYQPFADMESLSYLLAS